MNTRMWWMVLLLAGAPLSVLAAGGTSSPLPDPNSELALRLFSERERAREAQAPAYVWVVPTPGPFSAQALEQQNRAMMYWLWNPDLPPPWPMVPYWPSVYPMGWPPIPPWMPPPATAP